MRALTLSLLFTLCALIGFAAMHSVGEVAHAQGASSAGSGSASAAPVDPVAHPKEAYDSVREALKTGIPYGVTLGLYILAAALSSRAKPGSWLDKGRLPTALAGATSVLAAILLALAHEANWSAVIGALALAVGTYLHADPPKKAAKLSAV